MRTSSSQPFVHTAILSGNGGLLESTATPFGEFNLALVAGAPSPEEPSVPLPAIVVIAPFDA
jgi:hypothetical protein